PTGPLMGPAAFTSIPAPHPKLPVWSTWVTDRPRAAVDGLDSIDTNNSVGIWRLTWPLMLSMCLNLAIGLFDTWIAGRFGPTVQATVGITMQLVFFLNTIIAAVGMGCQALVS